MTITLLVDISPKRGFVVSSHEFSAQHVSLDALVKDVMTRYPEEVIILKVRFHSFTDSQRAAHEPIRQWMRKHSLYMDRVEFWIIQ